MTQNNIDPSNDALKLRKYRKAIPADRYCIDATTEQKTVAVTCNRCKEGKPCIHTCCPFDKTFNQPDITIDGPLGPLVPLEPDELFGPKELLEHEGLLGSEQPTCIDSTSNISLEFFTPDDKRLEWEEGTHYILVGPTHHDGLKSNSNEFVFNCPIKENAWYDKDQEGLKLDSSGRLHGNSEVDDDNYTTGTYCVFNGNQGILYASCDLRPQTSQNNYCEDIRKDTFNAGFVFSIIFIIFSIIAHIKVERKDMFVKISVVYLVNMLGQFLVIVVDKYLDPEKGSVPCVWIAYSKQYFSLSFFFSINVLAILLYNSINAMGNVSKFRILRYIGKVLDPNKKSFLWIGIVYIQGVPLLITLLTWIMDLRRIELKQIVAFWDRFMWIFS